MVFARKGLMRIAAAAGVIALALTGCSGGGGGDGSTGAPLPDDQQNLTFVPNYGVQGLDVAKYPLEIGVNMVATQILEPLVKIEDGEIVPHLAESWEWTSDTTLVFQLREDVTFSDGQPMTSADVVGTLQRYIDAKVALNAILSVITSLEVTDDHTVTVTTSRPIGTLVGVLSMVLIGPASAATDDSAWVEPIGTGPFVIDDYVANDHVSMSRNETYWGEKAKLKTLTIKLIPDVSAKVTALANNQAQVIGDLPYDQIESVKATSGVTFTQAESLNYWFIWFENEHTPLDDQRVRQAMWEAIDLPTIISSLYGETAAPMAAFCPAAAFGCLAPTNGLPEYDPEHARQLLADAGYADGFTVDIIFNTANAGVNNLVQALVSQWKEVGVTVEPRGMDATNWLAAFTGLDWDMDVQPNQTITGDADYTLNRLYSCAAKRLGYCNPELDALMTQAQTETDPDAREPLYQQVADILAEDLPLIPIFEIKSNVAMRSNVEGLEIPPTAFIDFSTVYLTDAA